MMRILLINNWFPPDMAGGAEIALRHTCQGLQRASVTCSLLAVTTRGDQPVDEWFHVDHIPVHRVHFHTRLPLQEVVDWRVYRTVRREIAAVKPDVVHIHNVSGASLAPFLACRQAGAPVVNTLHDLWLLCPNNMRYRSDRSYCDPARYPNGCDRCFRLYDYWAPVPQRRRLFQTLTANVRRFLSPSQALIERHVEAGYARERFQLVPSGLAEPPAAEPQHPIVRQLVRAEARHPIVLFAGGGNEHKGAHIFLAAIPALHQQFPNLQFIIAGGGDPHLLDQFRAFGPAVRTLGQASAADMRALYAMAELSIVASVCHENSPVVIYESFQMGTPVAGSRFGGIPELIDEERTGYLFPVGDATALAEKVVRHFQKAPWERRRMRLHCVETARTRLGLDTHVAAHLQVYKDVRKR